MQCAGLCRVADVYISFLMTGDMDMQEPLITVILPSLNVEKYIDECMGSVLCQSFSRLEILCIDAGSTDGTRELLEAYAESDCRIKVVCSDVKSYGAQVNMGIAMAKGKYVAVVETDDFIDKYMFEKLYSVAEENALDFAKADFKGFRTLSNGQRIYDEGKVWRNDDLYGKVISVEDFPELYLRDVNIWKGIYSTEFLQRNNIKLNETGGAAFQDIGFEHLFLRFAKKGMYIKDMLYYYRRDNDNSSSNKPYGIRFAYQEYKRLLELPLAGGDKKYFEQYLYVRMIAVFVGEYEKLLDYDTSLILEFRQVINWFKTILKTKIDKQEVVKTDTDEITWKKLNMLINDEETFCEKWKHEYKERKCTEKKWIDNIGEYAIVIFGCGHFGKECLLFCDKNKLNIIALSDNKSALWGTEYCRYEVCRPEDLLDKYIEAKIVISTKKYEESIKNQLMKMGICEERIVPYPDCLA